MTYFRHYGTCTATSTRLLKTTNSSSSTSCPAMHCHSRLWLVCLGGAILKMMWEFRLAEIWFRGKFSNVLTRVKGSEGNCARAGLKEHLINWIHIKIRLPEELLDVSNAFKKGVWVSWKRWGQWTWVETKRNLNMTFTLFGRKVLCFE